MNKSIFLLAVVACLVGAREARAVAIPIVQNTTTNTVLLADDFESPAAPANPVAATGTWVVSESGTGTVNSSTAQEFEGSQSVEIKRPPGSFATLVGNFTAPTVGQTVHARFMVYVNDPVGGGLPNIFLFEGGAGTGSTGAVSITPSDDPSNGVGPAGSADSIRLVVGNFGTFTPKFSSTLFSAFETNKWQEWEIIHTRGTNTATFKIDGVSDTHTDSTPASIGGLQFTGGVNGSNTFYIDAVPEPSALGFVALSGLFLRRRRD